MGQLGLKRKANNEAKNIISVLRSGSGQDPASGGHRQTDTTPAVVYSSVSVLCSIGLHKLVFPSGVFFVLPWQQPL